ncbi:MAG TPA: response regulator transcription factor [Bryobacteraceae bacterium]|nr:response regulator transcription factor [Bryobacteraceae bacterium]
MSDESGKIRLLLVDDHALFREGLARLLASEPDFDLAVPCSSGEEALRVLESREIDLILLDYDLGAETGSRFLVLAAQRGFQGRVLVVTAGLGDNEVAEMLRLGVTGIFLKHNPPSLLAKAIRKVMAGEIWLDQRYLKILLQESRASDLDSRGRKLSERERDVLRSVFQGLANKEIAVRLQVSESSVKATLQQLFFKTGVRTRSQLVRVALEQYRDCL